MSLILDKLTEIANLLRNRGGGGYSFTVPGGYYPGRCSGYCRYDCMNAYNMGHGGTYYGISGDGYVGSGDKVGS